MKTQNKRCSCGVVLPAQETGRPRTECAECRRAARAARRRTVAAQRHQPVPEEALAGAGLSRETIAATLGLAETTVRETEATALRKLRQHPEILEAWRDWISAGKPTPVRPSVGQRLLAYQERIVDWYELQTRLLLVGEAAIADQCAREIEPMHQKIGSILQQFR